MTKSRIFLFVCLSFVLGVFIQSLIEIPQLVWLGILVLGVALAAVFWGRDKRMAVAGFCLLILAGGAWRYLTASEVMNSIAQLNDKGRTAIVGVISAEPDVRSDNIKYKIKAVGNYEGYFLATAKKYPSYNYGDQIEIIGRLQTPKSDEDFDYQSYLAKDEIYSVVYYPEIKLLESDRGNFVLQKLFWLKNKFERSINNNLIEPQAAFLAGLLLGEKRGLPENIMADFSRTGTTHIVALSGYNITIIAVAMMGLFNFFLVRRRISFWLSLGAIFLFVLMTGAAASVVRAAVMGALILVAQQAGRLYRARNALIFAGAVMVYFNPKILVFDLGFQLSFAATLGLIYLTPVLQTWLEPAKDDLPVPGSLNSLVKSLKPWREILIATLAAQLAVLPLLVINFSQLSLIAPLANLLILPFIPATMFLGFLSALGGLVWLGFGKVLAWPAWLLLTYEIKITEFLSKIPLAAINFKWNWVGGVIYYLLLGIFIRYVSKNKK